MKSFKKSPLKFTASLKAVIAQFHRLPYPERVNNIVKRVQSLEEDKVKDILEKVKKEFAHRHKNFEAILNDNFLAASTTEANFSNFSQNRKLLLGAYLTKEYSLQAAALFNPSIVAHPDQSGLKEGEQRFVMSLRATGEGHISSIIFKTGKISKTGEVVPDEDSGYFSVLKKVTGTPATGDDDSSYDLASPANISISERVLSPTANLESNGMEDLRLVKFEDGPNSMYYGTYTAYDGKRIRTMLLETTDFSSFKIRSLYGDAINDKGMAIFPEKINGKYVICSRQGSEKLSIMFSDDLYKWDTYKLLREPEYDWEFVQIGNCGSPVKTSAGWLLLTHGVGAMRKYVISAILLDLNDPAKVIGRLEHPLIEANEEEREGYVPNVVYTCGSLKHDNLLIIPYAVSDTTTVFASVEIDQILNEMK